MDNKQLLTIVITALVAAFMKELFAWLLRSGGSFAKTVLAGIKKRFTPWVIRHWRGFVIGFDCLMMAWMGYLALSFAFNADPLTKRLVFFIALNVGLFWYWFRELRTDIASLGRARADLALQQRFQAIGEALKQIVRDVKSIRLQHELFKAEYLFAAKMHGNSFTGYMDAASLAQNMGETATVDSILSDLEKRITSMDGIFGSDIQRLSSFIERLDNVNSLHKQRIADALRKARKL